MHCTGSCSVSLAGANILPTASAVNWDLTTLGSAIFKPSKIYPLTDQIPPGDRPYDIVLLSVSLLQDFQTVCTDMAPHISEKTVVAIETTGYVNLEPFVLLSLPRFQNLPVCSLMNEYDIRQLSSTYYSHTAKSGDNRIYIGSSSGSPLQKSENFGRLYKLLQIVQEDSRGSIGLLKSSVPKEFMTYQWKLALPRIVFSPLAIVFEEPYPAQLTNQILCKPLITGIINEIFKIIKKMDCKLVKGSENEQNLLKNWALLYPAPKSHRPDADYLLAPQLFYDFFHQHDLEIDLLLLQPILLGDDHGVRTPYLENLYSIMCQLIKFNSKDGQSVFFVRKGDQKHDTAAFDKFNQDYEFKLDQLNILTEDLSRLNLDKQQADSYLHEKSILRTQVDKELAAKQLALEALKTQVETQQRLLAELLVQNDNHAKIAEENARIAEEQARIVKAQKVSQEEAAIASEHSQKGKLPQNQYHNGLAPNGAATPPPKNRAARESVMIGDNLEDLTDIALYGAALNGEKNPTPKDSALPNSQTVATDILDPNADPASLQNKENELRKREQALLEREMQLTQESRQTSQPDLYQYDQGQYNGQFMPFNGPPLHYNSLQGSQNPFHQQMDQHPNGMGPNGMGPNGPPKNQQRYQNGPPPGPPFHPQQFPPQQPPYAGRQRVPSVPSSVNSFYDNNGYQNGGMPPNFGGPMPPQGGQNSYFMNGAPGPVDPQFDARFKGQKKQNRRLAFPHMEEGALNIDYGGRGGMPMPTGASNTKNKHRSMMPMTTGGSFSGQGNGMGLANPPVLQQRKPQGLYLQIQPTQNPAPQPQPALKSESQQYLQPPNVTDSNGSTNSSFNSTNTNDTPRTSDSPEISSVQIQVPINANAKPLGATSGGNKGEGKKKKRGLFGKK